MTNRNHSLEVKKSEFRTKCAHSGKICYNKKGRHAGKTEQEPDQMIVADVYAFRRKSGDAVLYFRKGGVMNGQDCGIG